jgi:TRAP-type mannitol/chloroaromatic compound transport system permease small subunit
VLHNLTAGLEAAVEWFGRLAALCCILLVLLVAGNVFGRYFLSTGTIWLEELEWHLLSPIALLGMAYTLLHGDQVRVDFLFDRFSPRAKALIEVLTGVLIVIFAGVLVKLSIPFVMQAYRIGEGSPNPGGVDYRFLLKAFIPLGFAVLAVQGVCHVLKHSASVLNPRK